MRRLGALCLSLALGCQCGDGAGEPSAAEKTAPPSVEAPPFPKESACRTLSFEAPPEPRPVDVIMVIDNSSSMTHEIEAVEDNVNVSFADILAQSGADWRIILVSKHGSASSEQSVCIRAPLSGTSCEPLPPAPVNGERFFHYDAEVSSINSLSLLLSTYEQPDVHGFAPRGWRDFLRPDSVKTFIAITDDGADLGADAFELGLYSKLPAGMFGDPDRRGFIFHSIIGIVPNSPRTAPWTPGDPKQGAKCASAAAPGQTYEDLSLRTGGLRFPVCETSSYDAVFRAAAQEVILSAGLSCEVTAPTVPPNEQLVQSYIEYWPGGGSVMEYLLLVPDASSCGPDRFTADPITHRITLCPQACSRVRADAAARLSVFYACGPRLN